MELQHIFDTAVTVKDLLPVVIAGGFSTGMLGLLKYIDYRIRASNHKEYLNIRQELKKLKLQEKCGGGGKILSQPIKQ